MSYRYNDSTEVDDSYEIDDSTSMSDYQNIFSFVNLLLGIVGSWFMAPISRFVGRFNKEGTIKAKFR